MGALCFCFFSHVRLTMHKQWMASIQRTTGIHKRIANLQNKIENWLKTVCFFCRFFVADTIVLFHVNDESIDLLNLLSRTMTLCALKIGVLVITVKCSFSYRHPTVRFSVLYKYNLRSWVFLYSVHVYTCAWWSVSFARGSSDGSFHKIARSISIGLM